MEERTTLEKNSTGYRIVGIYNVLGHP